MIDCSSAHSPTTLVWCVFFISSFSQSPWHKFDFEDSHCNAVCALQPAFVVAHIAFHFAPLLAHLSKSSSMCSLSPPSPLSQACLLWRGERYACLCRGRAGHPGVTWGFYTTLIEAGLLAQFVLLPRRQGVELVLGHLQHRLELLFAQVLLQFRLVQALS